MSQITLSTDQAGRETAWILGIRQCREDIRFYLFDHSRQNILSYHLGVVTELSVWEVLGDFLNLNWANCSRLYRWNEPASRLSKDARQLDHYMR